MTVRVYYNSHAPEDMYALIRQAMPAGLELATLDHDDDGERCARIADCEIAIVAATPLTRAVIDAGTKLRLVHHQGVGYHDTVDTAALAERGIALALTPAGTSGAVAEHTVLLILATFRHLAFADAELRQGRWHINSLRPRSRELAGCTIGYIGMGRIGQETARRLKPFGTRGLYYDPQVTLPADTAAMLGVAKADLGTLLHQADVVTLHVPSTPDTRHLIDAAALARMKPDAILVNTARGPVVDEGALAAALAGGHLLGAGLDVFEHEPVTPANPLTRLPNVVLTPHISAGTRDAILAKMQALFANVGRFLAGEAMENRVELPARGSG